MRRWLALAVLGGSLALGAAAYVATPLRAALYWAAGGGCSVEADCVRKRHQARPLRRRGHTGPHRVHGQGRQAVRSL